MFRVPLGHFLPPQVLLAVILVLPAITAHFQGCHRLHNVPRVPLVRSVAWLPGRHQLGFAYRVLWARHPSLAVCHVLVVFLAAADPTAFCSSMVIQRYPFVNHALLAPIPVLAMRPPWRRVCSVLWARTRLRVAQAVCCVLQEQVFLLSAPNREQAALIVKSGITLRSTVAPLALWHQRAHLCHHQEFLYQSHAHRGHLPWQWDRQAASSAAPGRLTTKPASRVANSVRRVHTRVFQVLPRVLSAQPEQLVA